MAQTAIKLTKTLPPVNTQMAIYRANERRAANRSGNKGVKAFERVVENWSSVSRPTFFFRVKETRNGLQLTIEYREADQKRPVWKWVNETGTKAHPIRPKPGNKSKRLFFPWGGPGSYEPKTRANPARFGGPGVVRNATLTVAMAVSHPGFEPRHFDVPIAKDLEPDFLEGVYQYGRRGLRSAKG